MGDLAWFFVLMATSVVAFVAYMVPTIVAGARHHRQVIAICALNMLLGWTVLGWVGALVWSLTETAPTRPPDPV